MNRARASVRHAVHAAIWMGALLLAMPPTLAGELNISGDGSLANNPDLARSTPVAGCATTCAGAPRLDTPPVVLVTPDRLLPGGRSTPLMLDPGLPGMPIEGDAPYLQTDWLISLRGSYVEATKATQIGASVLPEFSLIHESRRGTFTLVTDAELEMVRGQDPRVTSFGLDASQMLALDPVTNLTLGGGLSVAQQDPSDPDVARNIVQTPVALDGNASVSIDRQFGQFALTAAADGERSIQSDTILRRGVVEANNDLDYWRGGGTLRAGYALTPIFTPFVEGQAHYTAFDAAPRSTGRELDGWEYILSAGLAANWQDVFTAEASAGYAVRQFDVAALSDLPSMVYALDLSYAFDQTVTTGASLSTTIDPGDPDNKQPASIIYAGSLDASYLLNSWLNLRGSLSGSFTDPNTGRKQTLSLGAGVGADLALSENAKMTLDYGYDESHTITQPIERAHEFALGVTFSR